MVTRSMTSARLVLVLALLSGACSWDAPLVPDSDEPFLYVVLNQRSISHYGSIEKLHQLALLLTAGSPVEPMEYRSAERFEMWRTSDGRRFDWRAFPNASVSPGTGQSVEIHMANYYLPDSTTAAGLGAADLRWGETYELKIETEGVVVRGRVTIPAAFTAKVEVRDGQRIVTWPRVAGAAGYSVGAYPYSRQLQRDTFYVVPADAPPGPMSITAVDPNLYQYLIDENLARSGIDAGYGVFGAISATWVDLPSAR